MSTLVSTEAFRATDWTADYLKLHLKCSMLDAGLTLIVEDKLWNLLFPSSTIYGVEEIALIFLSSFGSYFLYSSLAHFRRV